MADEHLIVKAETTFGTFVTPDTAFPILKANIATGQEYLDKRYTGKGRALANSYLSSKAPSGSIEMDLWPDKVGMFLKAAGLSDITTTTPGGGTLSREHAFLLASDSALKSMSMQYKQTASQAVNVLSASFSKLVIKAVKGETVNIAMDYLCKDEAPAGGTWIYNGGASPAVISSPTYISSTLRPYLFYDAVVTTGGTVAIDGTSKQMSVTSPTTQTKVESVEITIENKLEQAHFLVADRTPGVIAAQEFDVSIQFDVDMTSFLTTFYDHARTGSNAAFVLTLTGGLIEGALNYMFKLTLPSLSFRQADYPDISGEQKRRVQTVQATGIVHSTVNHALGITIRDTATSY